MSSEDNGAPFTKQPLPLRCDGCAVGAPEITYSLPKGTPLTGRMVSSGFFCLCRDCWWITHEDGVGRRGALLIGRRMVDGNAQLSRFHGDDRKRCLSGLTEYLERILPKLSDPRPFKDGQDPLQATALLPPGHEKITIWCPTCGKPLKKGDECHGHVY